MGQQVKISVPIPMPKPTHIPIPVMITTGWWLDPKMWFQIGIG